MNHLSLNYWLWRLEEGLNWLASEIFLWRLRRATRKYIRTPPLTFDEVFDKDVIVEVGEDDD